MVCPQFLTPAESCTLYERVEDKERKQYRKLKKEKKNLKEGKKKKGKSMYYKQEKREEERFRCYCRSERKPAKWKRNVRVTQTRVLEGFGKYPYKN